MMAKHNLHMKRLLFLIGMTMIVMVPASLAVELHDNSPPVTFSIEQDYDIRDCVLEAAYESIGVTEVGGSNRGKDVESYLATVKFGPGAAWCGAWYANRLSQCISITDMEQYMPISHYAYTPNYTKHEDAIIWKSWTREKFTYSKHRPPRSGDAFLLWNKRLNRIAHVGMIDYWSPGTRLVTIEGNTNDEGSRDGDGVFVRYRDKRQIHAVVDVITFIT